MLEVRRWEEAYIKDDHFDQYRMIETIKEALDPAEKQPGKVTRLVANMEWALEDRPGVVHLVCRALADIGVPAGQVSNLEVWHHWTRFLQARPDVAALDGDFSAVDEGDEPDNGLFDILGATLRNHRGYYGKMAIMNRALVAARGPVMRRSAQSVSCAGMRTATVACPAVSSAGRWGWEPKARADRSAFQQ